MATTIVFGIVGSIHGYIYTLGIEDWPIHIGGKPSSGTMTLNLNPVKDLSSFIIVGCIHNYSYLGGFIGLILGCLYQHRNFKKIIGK